MAQGLRMRVLGAKDLQLFGLLKALGSHQDDAGVVSAHCRTKVGPDCCLLLLIDGCGRVGSTPAALILLSRRDFSTKEFLGHPPVSQLDQDISYCNHHLFFKST